MTDLFFRLLFMLEAGFQIIPVQGVPVDMVPFETGFLVSCIDPPSVFFFGEDGLISPLPGVFDEPRNLAVWNGIPVISDFGAGRLVMGETEVPMTGEPEGMAEVVWDRERELAVCLFSPGSVVLVDGDGETRQLAAVPGAKSAVAADANRDGLQDLFVSGCGTGVVLLENREGEALVHYIGNTGAGVKRIAAYDMDGDGFVDVAGIACADGGAGWWRNPGEPASIWEYTPMYPFLEGPKDISIAGGSMVIASLFSPLILAGHGDGLLPRGFTSCCILDNGQVLAGHRNGFLVFGSLPEGITVDISP